MKKQKNKGFDLEIDELTNSIRNIISGDSFSTDISRITRQDVKKITKKEGWQFDWKLELKHPERDVYKLTIVNNQSIIQGLISLELRPDHIFLHLVESAPFNKGKAKLYSGVPGNLGREAVGARLAQVHAMARHSIDIVAQNAHDHREAQPVGDRKVDETLNVSEQLHLRLTHRATEHLVQRRHIVSGEHVASPFALPGFFLLRVPA